RERCEGLGRRPAGQRQSGGPALERRQPLLEAVGRRTHDAAVDVPEFLQGKQAGGMIGVVKNVGSRLVNGHGARLGGGVFFLPAVDGKGRNFVWGFLSVVVGCHVGAPILEVVRAAEWGAALRKIQPFPEANSLAKSRQQVNQL